MFYREVKLRRDENENMVQTDFTSLMPGGSLSADLKHSTVWEKVSRQQPVQVQVHNKAQGVTT